MPRTRLLLSAALLALVALSGAGGCVQRTISITSEPAGALVFLNDEEVGRTPVTVPFTFYGTYDVRLERQGYQPLWTKQEAKSPWWETPGPDLIAEAIPDNDVELQWHFALDPETPAADVDSDALLEQAQQLRSRVRQSGPQDAAQ